MSVCVCVSVQAHRPCSVPGTALARPLGYNGEQILTCSQKTQTLMSKMNILKRTTWTNIITNGTNAQGERNTMLWEHHRKKSGRMGWWVVCAKARCRRQHSRSTEVKDYLAGPQRTLAENSVCTLLCAFWSHLFNKYVLSPYGMQGLC